jgi:integrase
VVVKILKRVVDAAQPDPNGKEIKIWDDELKGFVLRVRPNGAKMYMVFYRVGPRQRWFTIGRHGSPWTPETARRKAEELLYAARNGGDPQEEKVATREGLTVAQLIDLYLEQGPIDKPTKRATTWQIDRSNLKSHAEPLLGRKLAASLTSNDIADFQRAVAIGKTAKTEKSGKKRGRVIVTGGAGTAKRTMTTLAAMLQWAVRRGYVPANPAKGVATFNTQKRERYLSADEVRRLYEAIDVCVDNGNVHASHASIFRVLLLTGCRKSEIAALKWDEIDLQRKALVLPELRSKTGARRIPLSDEVLAELKKQPRISDFVFPAIKTDRAAKEERPTVGLRRSWLRVCKAAKIEGVRIHDLRHSFASFAVEQGESLYVLGKALGHRKASTTERYAHLRDDPVRDLVERMSRHVAAARSTPEEAA